MKIILKSGIFTFVQQGVDFVLLDELSTLESFQLQVWSPGFQWVDNFVLVELVGVAVAAALQNFDFLKLRLQWARW